MTNLTKLTPKELLSVWPLEDDEIAEIRTRLVEHEAMKKSLQHVTKRLEQCEAALRPFIDDHDCPLCDAARAALEEK